MARFKTIAGHFKNVIEKQVVKITQTEHVRNDAGHHMFEEDGVKPVMREILVDTFVDVPVRRWIDEVHIPLTPEEEAERDAEEAQYEIEKARTANESFLAKKKLEIDKLTLKMSEELLLSDEDGKNIKSNYREIRKRIEDASSVDELNQLEIK